jgi:hypothetical protein
VNQVGKIEDILFIQTSGAIYIYICRREIYNKCYGRQLTKRVLFDVSQLPTKKSTTG